MTGPRFAMTHPGEGFRRRRPKISPLVLGIFDFPAAGLAVSAQRKRCVGSQRYCAHLSCQGT